MRETNPTRSYLRNLNRFWQLAVEYHDDLRYPEPGSVNDGPLPGVGFAEMPLRPIWLAPQPPDGEPPHANGAVYQQRTSGDTSHEHGDLYPPCPEYDGLGMAGTLATAHGAALSQLDEVVYWPAWANGKREGFVWISASDRCPIAPDARYPDSDQLMLARGRWCTRHPSQRPPKA